MKKLFKQLYILPLALLGGFLGALGGSEDGDKKYRRLGIPLLCVLIGIIYGFGIKSFIFISLYIPMCLGYGIPDETDEGSVIGAFFYRLTHQNRVLSDVLTRGVVGVAYLPTFALWYFLIKSWGIVAWVSVGTILNNLIIGGIWKPQYSFKLFNKHLILEEFLIYLIQTQLIIALILWK